MTKKNLLFVRITQDVLTNSAQGLFSFVQHFNINIVAEDIKNVGELEALLRGNRYDYIYLAGHGDETCFTDNQDFNLTWSEIGNLICETNCLNPESIIMLYCCKGGMGSVVYQLMGMCENIKYVCGAKQSVSSLDLTTAFTMFLYHYEHRHINPVISAQKASLATDIRLECYDRGDVEMNPLFHQHYFCEECGKGITEEE
ncbi:hypothetical protein GCM10022393_39650 [Aquimarina addita]|uniref:CHAT domain-containing protein n=1 Tax=Aquimarina addita TaxID=870485 RepID=A0ABP6UVG4_9FLAO